MMRLTDPPIKRVQGQLIYAHPWVPAAKTDIRLTIDREHKRLAAEKAAQEKAIAEEQADKVREIKRKAR